MVAIEGQSQLLFRAMRPTNAYEETMQRLLQSIRLGMIPLGERLPPERDLASMLKVSRDTVREAISTLTEQGFVVSKRGRYGGTFVVERLPDRAHSSQGDLTEREINDIIILRRVLELGAVKEAAGRELRAAERAGLVEALDACDGVVGEDARRLDSRLHVRIAELSGSPSLMEQVADLRTRLNSAFEVVPDLMPNLVNSDEQHHAIVAAILAGRPDAAVRAMTEHLHARRRFLRGYWATTTFSGGDD